jgi:hypothetical protein
MKLINKILAIVTIISVLVGVFVSIRNSSLKLENDRLETNLYAKTIQYQDELGRTITETTQLKVTVGELKKITKMDSSKMNSYEKTIYRISKELENNGASKKNTEAAGFIVTESKFQKSNIAEDTVIRGMKAKTVRFIDPYGTYESTYFPETDTISLIVVQRTELFLELHKQRELNKKGKKVCILWRWAKDWEYNASIKSMGDSTEIKSFNYIKIN